MTLADYQRFIVGEFARFELRYAGKPYEEHLIAVREVLTRFGFIETIYPELHGGAIGHDYFEDVPPMRKVSSEILLRELRAMEVEEEWLQLALSVTNEPGINRAEKASKTYPKIVTNWKSIGLKLSDRIANTEYSLNAAGRGSLLKMYTKEYPKFREALKANSPEELDKMWEYLESISL